jgi:hypothetical protein
MIARGEDGVLKRLPNLSRWGCGKTLGVGGGVSRFVKYEVGDMSKIRFWHDL